MAQWIDPAGILPLVHIAKAR